MTPFNDSRPAEPSSSLPSDLPLHSVEAITMTTLYDMLARVLEQTHTLWQAQASTNCILNELRRSIPAPQENVTLAAHIQHDLHAPAQPGQGIRSVSSVYQGRSTWESAPQPSFVQSVVKTPSCDAPVNPPPPPDPIISTREAAHHIDSIPHASCGQYSTLAPDTHNHHDQNNDELKLPILPPSGEPILVGVQLTPSTSYTIDKFYSQMPLTIPSLGHIDQSTADPVISPEQMRLPEPQHGSELTIMSSPSTIEEVRERSLGALDHRVSLASRECVPSRPTNIISEDTLHACQEQLDAKLEPSIPPRRDLDEASTVATIHCTAQDTTRKCAFDPREAIQKETERNALSPESSATEREYESVHKPDDKRQLSFAAENTLQVLVTERIEALHNQLVVLTNLIRQTSTFCGEKKVLMEQQWSERLRWKEECSQQIRKLMDMASWLVEDRAAIKQCEEHQKQVVQNNSRIEQVVSEIRECDMEHRELLKENLDAWRADNKKQSEDVISAVRATANQLVPFNIDSYLHAFTKALGIEVTVLVSEVGNLREERRRIQHEIGYLMTMQSTLIPSGNSGADWPPEYSSQVWPSPAGIPLPESPHPHSGWHAVPSQANRHAPRLGPSPSPSPAPERQVQAWSRWRPDPALVPSPPFVEATLLVPDRESPGLFGPPSPRVPDRD